MWRMRKASGDHEHVPIRPHDIIGLLLSYMHCGIRTESVSSTRFHQPLISRYSTSLDPTMSDFIRRASDAFHRQRQGSAASTGSTDEPASPNAAKPPTQEPMKKAESAPAVSQTKETVAGTTASMVSLSRAWIIGSE